MSAMKQKANLHHHSLQQRNAACSPKPQDNSNRVTWQRFQEGASRALWPNVSFHSETLCPDVPQNGMHLEHA